MRGMFLGGVRCVVPGLVALVLLLVPGEAPAFCGFYVARADTSLYNRASQVVMVRDGNRTVISMMNDYEGEPEHFALVVPVPSVPGRDQINAGDAALFQRIDAFTAPRLVEYFDPDPCLDPSSRFMKRFEDGTVIMFAGQAPGSAQVQGVEIEARYAVGAYDIVILSSGESGRLEEWLRGNGYAVPEGAGEVLAPYIRQGMKFFVARVNLDRAERHGPGYLQPLQIAFESDHFMLPLRLGMLNAEGPQELVIHAITKKGRVEIANYPTVKLPTGMDIPVYIKKEFPDFYRAMFAYQAEKEQLKAVFTEYFWDMGWCDPCVADPLTPIELRELGVFWLDDGLAAPQDPQSGRALPVKVTRLHLRYTKDTFPDDLILRETADTENFQSRYVLRHPWAGEAGQCERAGAYLATLPERHDREARNLAGLTGWDVNEIRKRIRAETRVPGSGAVPGSGGEGDAWWKKLWKHGDGRPGADPGG